MTVEQMKAKEIQELLDENKIYGEASVNPINGDISINIEWGDWKHDHIRCYNLMKSKGYEPNGMDVTEEDESDCYSAIHYFKQANK